MTASEGQVDHYAAVLADLRAQRDRIDHAIAVIENLRAGTPLTASRHSVANAPSRELVGGAK